MRNKATRATAIGVLFAIVLGLIPVGASAAGVSRVSVVPYRSTNYDSEVLSNPSLLEVNDTFAVWVMVYGATDLQAVEFDIEYPTSVLDVEQYVDPGSGQKKDRVVMGAFDEVVMTAGIVDRAVGTVRLVAANQKPGDYDSEYLLKIGFKVVGEGEAYVRLREGSLKFVAADDWATPGLVEPLAFTVVAAPEKTLAGITAVFNQGNTIILNTHGLSVLHQMLTVTATYSDKSTAVLTSDQYQLSGTLYSGSPIITVTYQEKSATFVVKVTSGGGGGGTIPGGDTGSSGTGQQGGGTTIPEEPTPLGFGDVQEGDWFYDAVKYVLDKGLFKGTSDTTFEPNTPMTRGMFVTVLSRIEFGSDEDVPVGTSPFTDLTQDWYKNAVAWAAANGIVNGLSDTEFGPDVPVTREQMAAILYRYAEYKELDTTFDEADIADFEDVEAVSDYALDAMKWAVSKGLITGKTSTTLAPKESATRAQVATIVMRFGAFAE